MAIHELEWLIIAVIVTVLILWDPGKIPKIARAVAEAKKEYENAVASLSEQLTQEVEGKQLTSDEKILKIAGELGIQTEGKTREEIVKEILEKLGIQVEEDREHIEDRASL
ncbi:MAG: twin-arginine translocase TatA/TatE family subunit [Thaumarchaeota archaeon]|nr:MAG: twin-arginine translocase TatA/TatE family subunit [Nitrososphaerota archaeon]HDD56605.1 twin-arginine translocase TatA/TatE family subunit [Nitrososphaeria archaeon]